MTMTPNPSPQDESIDLRRISTRWAEINEPARFAMRYAPAIRNYLLALVRNPNDADDIAQEFLLQVTRAGFPTANPERGKFRFYLITAVRNAARAWFQRRQAK